MKKDAKPYWTLFASSFTVSMFIIGGGYVAIPLFKKRFVEQLNWMTDDEMTDLVAIAQSSPGAVAVNTAILVGYRVAGFAGSLCTIAGTVLPPLLLLSLIEGVYSAFIGNAIVAALFRGMNAAVAAVMVDVVWRMGRDALKSDAALSVFVMLAVFALVWFFKINAAFVMLGSIAASLIYALVFGKTKAVGQ